MSEAEAGEDKSTLKQPRIVVVGSDITNLKYYVSVATKKYYAENVCQAVEIGMFFFLGMNLQYPCESDTVWEFLQQLIFCVPVIRVGQQLRELIEKVGKF